MPKSAQQKFNEYLDECRETRDAINEVEKASRENHDGSYAYACGLYSTLLAEAIGELPRARREDFRSRMLRMAQTQKNEQLAKLIKEA
jgi:hypothetical protein